MKVFWIVFILSILFIIASASALKYLDKLQRSDNDEDR